VNDLGDAHSDGPQDGIEVAAGCPAERLHECHQQPKCGRHPLVRFDLTEKLDGKLAITVGLSRQRTHHGGDCLVMEVAPLIDPCHFFTCPLVPAGMNRVPTPGCS